MVRKISIVGSGCAVRSPARRLRCVAMMGIAALSVALAHAADSTLLIQTETAGKFKVWHTEGETNLTEQELILFEATAVPEGGSILATGYGPAQAYETSDGIVIVFAEARRDRKLLLDHDACSAVKAWHSEGATQLTDDQLADLVVTATPDGGATVAIGAYRAKAYLTKLGVMATLWKPVARRPAAQ